MEDSPLMADQATVGKRFSVGIGRGLGVASSGSRNVSA